MLAITCFTLFVTSNLIPSCPENSQQNHLSFYSHIQKGKEAKTEEDLINLIRMEKGVALLRSLKIGLLTANKSELGTFALVNDKRITATFLSVGIFRDHLPFQISSELC